MLVCIGELASRLVIHGSFGPPEVLVCYGFNDLLLIPLLIYSLPGILIGTVFFLLIEGRDNAGSFGSFSAFNLALIFLFYTGLWVHISILGGIELQNTASIFASIILLIASYIVYSLARKAGIHRLTPGRLSIICMCIILFVSLLYTIVSKRMTDKRLRGLEEEGRDILLITLDTVRRDALGCYGNPQFKTPTLDSLAHNGLLFKEVVSQSPFTAPSHASLLTSLYPASHGVRTNGSLLKEGTLTLPLLLSRSGYRSVAILSGSSLSHDVCGLNTGFLIYDDVFTPLEGFMRTSMGGCAWRLMKKILPGPFASVYRRLQERKASDTVDTALFWISRLRGKLFMWVHFFDPHFTYIPPAPFETMYDPSFEGEFRPYKYLADPRRVFHNSIGITERERLHAWALYGGEISYTDRELGRFLAKLDQMDRLSRTLVIVVADHGEYFGEYDHYFTHNDLYDEVIKVPLIIVDPLRGKALGERETIVEVVDIMPTILQIVMSPIPESLQGESLIGETDENVHAFSDCGPCGKVSVRDNRSMLVYDLKSKEIDFVGIDNKEGMVSDQDESNLWMALKAWSAKVGLEEEAPPKPGENERLRSLGYIN